MGSAFGLVFAIIFYMIRRVINFRDWYGMHPGRLQGHGTGDHDPDLCMDTEGYDRQLGAAVFVEEAMRSVAGGIELSFRPLFSWLDVDLHLLPVHPGELLVS